MRAIRTAVVILIFLLILAWTIWPIVSVAIAGSIASAHGCQIDEGSAHPCIVNGEDIGERLYTMGVMGWAMLFTIPTGAIALLIFLVVLLVIWLVRRGKAQNRQKDQPSASTPSG